MEKVSLKDIDFKDKTFLFRYKLKDEALYNSIKKFGILSPIGLRKRDDNEKYQIIYGFKRVFIARLLKKFKTTDAHIFTQIDDKSAVSLILQDNINSIISPLDKANLLYLIKNIFNYDTYKICNYWNENFHHDKLNANQILQYLNLQKQPTYIKDALLNQHIDLNKAFFLSNCNSSLSKILLELNRHCKLNFNEFKQICFILQDLKIKIKDAISYIKKIPKEQRYKNLYKMLISLRYPKFSEYVNKYKQTRREITKGISKEIISITTHPFFEEDKINLTLKVNDEKSLKDALDKLLKAVKENKFKILFDIVKGTLEI